MMDEIDIQILDILQTNGRIRRNDLAERIGLSVPSTSDRLRKLEEAGYITEYTAVLNHKMVGKDITAFITVSVDSSKNYAKVLDHVAQINEILECHAITGDGSHLLKIRTDNTSALEKLLARIQSWQGIVGTKTHLVLSTSKETRHINVKTINNGRR
jgi:Lrp/AsnC family transcriptional regulator, leucine-responsive regulatory protein